MRLVGDLTPSDPEHGFQFPSEVELTVIGRSDAGLAILVPVLLEELGLTVLRESMQERPSREGNFVSLRITAAFPSRERYDAAHSALRAHEAIRWTV